MKRFFRETWLRLALAIPGAGAAALIFGAFAQLHMPQTSDLAVYQGARQDYLTALVAACQDVFWGVLVAVLVFVVWEWQRPKKTS
jgi:hypothetical protein